MSDHASFQNRKPNRLLQATSPYLRQHAYNPVDWREWNQESLAESKGRNLPIFLSIGYAACHWCHVMERESFENDVIATFLNDHFICIKVDREERPDLDHLYMTFTQAMTGSGGWPMSVWLTPDLKPFYAGTYFPPDNRYGRPGFLHLLNELWHVWQSEREKVDESAENITQHIREHLTRSLPSTPLHPELIDRAALGWMRRYDRTDGGFGNAPKFPHATEMRLVLRHALRSGKVESREAVIHSLLCMLRGGIYDQVGGGLHRYSVDSQWLVPHFEKMLYDQSLLLSALSDVMLTDGIGEEISAEISDAMQQTIQFLQREMKDPSGGYYASIDADSEGEEGKYYVWSAKEFDNVLGEKSHLMRPYFNVSEEGNFEGSNILHRGKDSATNAEGESISLTEIQQASDALLAARASRIPPQTDTKILTSWNGLLLASLVDSAIALNDHSHGIVARELAKSIRTQIWDGRKLNRGISSGVTISGELFEDYAYVLSGISKLLAADSFIEFPSNERADLYLFAGQLVARAKEHFVDSSARCYLSPADREDLLFRPQENTDGATPSPVGMFTSSLLLLSRVCGENSYFDLADQILQSLSGELSQFPDGMASMLLAYEQQLRPSVEVVIVGSYDRGEINRMSRAQWLHQVILLESIDGTHPSALFDHRREKLQQIYVCTQGSCQSPVSTLQEAGNLIRKLIAS